MIELVLITATIEAKEGREVSITDIPGAYFLTEMDELVHMKLEGRFAELLVCTAPQVYNQYVTIDQKGERYYT
eukprot:12822692-Ditylum_brightwellii.AAC.1